MPRAWVRLQPAKVVRTGEAAQGVLRALADPHPLLNDYRDAVQAVNDQGQGAAGPQLYPGSPRLLAQLLRPQDGLIVNEKHPEDVQALRAAMRGTNAAVHQRDAYEFWLAMLPTRTPRGAVVVDPPYEQTDERARITATLAAAQRKWAHGVTVIWYPLKERSTHSRWKEQLQKLRIPKFLNVEHWLYDSDQPASYNGAGLFFVNPPFAFTQALPPLLEALRAAVPKLGLDAPIPGGGTLKDIAAEVLAIARSGLNARGKLNKAGDNEAGFLNPLDEIVRTGKVPAQVLLDKFHGEWNGDISRVYEESF